MVKNLDGIKKLNPDDIKKYRKIVLSYIGEKDLAEVNEQKKFSQGASSLRKIDGISLNKINRFTAKGKTDLKKFSARGGFPPASLASPELQRGRPERELVSPSLGGEGEKEELPQQFAARAREAERLKEAIKRQEEERKRIKEEERQYQMKKEQAEKDQREQAESQRQEKIRMDKERVRQEEVKQKERKLAEEQAKWEEKIRLEELEKEEIRKVKENIRLEKMKRQEEIRRIKQEMKIKKQAAREKKKIKRRKVLRKIKKDFNFKLNNFFSEIKQNIIYIISFLTLFLAIAYIVFCLAALRFKPNNLIGWAANYLPVPVVITGRGVISYSDFRKIEDKNYLSLSLAEKKNYLVKWLVLRDLKEKYGLPAKLADDDLAIKYVLDKDFNQIGLFRINKINELLKSQSEIELLGKYADEYNDGVYYDGKSAVEKFGLAVLELAIGQTSKIMPRANGYYIIERIDDKNGQLGLKYLFIKARTLEQYVTEKSAGIKVFILAN